MKIRSLLVCLVVLTGLFCSRCVKPVAQQFQSPPVSPLPAVGMTTIFGVTDSTAQASINIEFGGTSPITAIGVCWDVNPNPTLPKSHAWYGAGLGSFTTTIGPLKSNTIYYVRSFATNANGTTYGDQVTFKMPAAFVHLNGNFPSGNNVFCASFVIQGSTIYTGWSSGGVYKSTDNGNTWATVNTGLNDLNIVCLVDGGGTLFVAGASGGVYRSTNGGGSWAQANPGPGGLNIFNLAYLHNKLFAGTSNGIFVSSDNGDSWSAITNVEQVPVGFLKVWGNTIYAGYIGYTNGNLQQKISSSTDDGVTWTRFGTTVSESYTTLSDLTVVGQKIFVASTNGLYTSNDNGNNWTLISVPYYSVHAVGANGNVVFAASLVCNNPFYLSVDNGNSFLNILSPGANGDEVNCLGANSAYVFVATYQEGIYRMAL